MKIKKIVQERGKSSIWSCLIYSLGKEYCLCDLLFYISEVHLHPGVAHLRPNWYNYMYCSFHPLNDSYALLNGINLDLI